MKLDKNYKTCKYNKFIIISYTLLFVFIIVGNKLYASNSSEQNSYEVAQQTIQVKGIVTDNLGEPLVGVSVVVKGSTQGAITNIDGQYTINVQETSSVLSFSFLGYVPQERAVGNDRVINITLKEDAQLLDEVVVVGYGSVKQKDLTSSVQTVKNKDLLAGSFSSPLETLNGKVAGVSVVSAAPGDPNQNPNAQIRGASSIVAGNGPLIVIDGMPGGDLRNVAQQDIESMTVLRDGAAAAIYGSRGANGVILIETKKGSFGKSSKVSITYDGYLDFDRVAAKPEILSPEEYLEHKRGEDDGARTGWYDALLNKDNFGQSHYLSVTSGSENTILRVSGNYKDKDAIDIASTRQEYGVKANFGQKALDGILEFGGNISYRVANEGYTDYDAFKMAVKLNPTTPIYDSNEESGYTRFYGYDEYNPVQRLNERIRDAYNDYSIVDLNAKVNFTKELNTELKVARQGHNKNYMYYETSKDLSSITNDRIGWAKQEYENWADWTLEWLVNYKKTVNKHAITALGGYSYQEFNWKKFYAENGAFPTDAFTYNNLDEGKWNKDQKGRLGMDSEKNKSKVIAFFGRVNYAYDDTYLLTGTLRYEGNSKFGKDNKWGYFPSASFAWRFSKLDFFANKRDIVDDLKLRFSYGVTGRSGFNPYTALAKYSGYGQYMNDAGEWVKVYGPGNNDSPNLHWEKQISYNLGLDWTLFGSRLSGSLDAFARKGQDVISDYDVPVPPFLHDKITTNVATTKATGVELSLDWNVVRTANFSYSTNLRGSYVKSVLDKFSNGVYTKGFMNRYGLPSPGNPGDAQRLEDNTEIGSFYGFKYAGVDDAGNIQIWKGGQEGSEKILGTQGNDNDETYIGNGGAPKLQWSWGHNFMYKNLDLSMFFTSRMDYDILNLYQMYYGLQAEPNINLLEDAYTRNGHIKSGKVMCDYFLENGNYVRMENITVGYSPKINWKYISNLRFYGTVRNVFTLTNYTGMDPANVDVNGLEPGIGKLDAYPVTRTFSFGLQVTF